MRELFAELRGRALWVVLGCLVCQMGLGFTYGMNGLNPYLLEEFGWSRALYASAQVPQGWVIALASPLVGFGVARLGGRAMLSISAALMALAWGAVAGVQSWWQLALAWSLVGLAVAGLGDITTGAVVTSWVRQRRGLLLGVVYTGSNLGGFAATRGMAALAADTSWRHAVAAVAIASLCILLPAAWLGVRDRAGIDPDADAAAAGDEDDEGSLEVRETLRTRSFWIIAAGLLSFWLYLFAVLGHFVLALTDAGVDPKEAAGYFSWAVMMGLVSKTAFGFLADRLGGKASLLLDYGLLALSSLFLIAVPSGAAAPVWAFLLIFGFSYAARDVVTPLIVVHCFGARNLAQIYGLLMLTILPGNSLGPVIPGWVHDRTGSYELAFIGLAAMNVGIWLLLWWVRDERAVRSR